MAQNVMTATFKQRIIDDLITAIVADDYTGVLVETQLRVILFTNTPALSQDTVFDDLTEATFGGYGAATPTEWSSERRDNQGNFSILSNSINFDCTEEPFGETITGAALVSMLPTANTLLYAQLFDTPINITGAGQGITYSAEFLLSFNMTCGEGCLC